MIEKLNNKIKFDEQATYLNDKILAVYIFYHESNNGFLCSQSVMFGRMVTASTFDHWLVVVSVLVDNLVLLNQDGLL